MASRTRNRGAHAAAHRAPRPVPRTAPPTRGTRARGAGAGDEQVGGSKLAALPRATIGKATAVIVVLGVITFGLVRGGAPSAEPTVQKFLLAWEAGQYKTAAAMTTGRQTAVAAALRGAYQQLDAANLELQMGRIRQHGTSATARFRASVDLGSGGLRWGYWGGFEMRQTPAGWRVLWNTSVIVPGLRPGDRLAVLTSMPSRAQVQNSAGGSLTRPSRVYIIGVHPDHLANAQRTADQLAGTVGLDENQVYGQIIAAPSTTFLGLLRLQPAAYDRVAHKLARIPGLIIRPRNERLFDSIAPAVTGAVGTETADVLRQDGVPYRPGATVGLSGLEAAYQRTLTGSPTTEVVVQNAAGRQVSVLKRWSGKTGTSVRTTVDSRAQLAADRALAGMRNSAAIVAVQANNGNILAVATHHGRKMPAVDPLAGHYRPGQVFTIVSTAALLETGFDPRSPIPCRAENSVGGIRFTNHPRETGLGSHPAFAKDFAHACGTAFSSLSYKLNAAKLASAARRFGIGATWQLKVDSYSGTIGSPSGFGQIAATSVGAGGVRVSPLDMALVAGLVQSGRWHAPQLVSGDTGGTTGLAAATGNPFSPRVIASLRKLMHATVTKGAGAKANVRHAAAIYGQVGNSRLDVGKHGLRAAWFVGYQGKIAFAVIEFSKSSNASAANLAGRFLRHLRSGS
jgi:cell division protein FtsI/penicillin-binding protein 2